MAEAKFEVEQFRSELAQTLFHVEGKPLSLENYPMCEAVYDGQFTKILLKTGRQVSKSTTLACFMIAECLSQPFFKTYYVSPTAEQTRKFSHTRVAKVLSYSPELRRSFIGPQSIDNVLLRLFRNGSEMAFTYASDDADRARGFSADRVNFDEIQDMQYDTVIPVIEECLSNSPYAYSLYAGTPKGTENTIQTLWDLSTQSEWVIKCDRCNMSTFVDVPAAIGAKGPICMNKRCGSYINPRMGRWIDMKPGAGVQGFHISQPIMPENVPAAFNRPADQERAMERWKRILYKLGTYAEGQFLNEVLGISTATGARLLSKEELEALCNENIPFSREPMPNSLKGIKRTFAGIDWSGGGGEVKGSEGLIKSRTVLWIWGEQADGRLRTMYYKVYPNAHPSSWIEDIVQVCNAWSVEVAGADAGEGALANSLLRDRLGYHKILQVRYMGMVKPVEYNPSTATYHTDRTSLIDNYALVLKQRGIVYGPLNEMTVAISDVLNVHEETTNHGKKVWRHSPSKPDDCLHAQIFGWFAWKFALGDLRFYANGLDG